MCGSDMKLDLDIPTQLQVSGTQTHLRLHVAAETDSVCKQHHRWTQDVRRRHIHTCRPTQNRTSGLIQSQLTGPDDL